MANRMMMRGLRGTQRLTETRSILSMQRYLPRIKKVAVKMVGPAPPLPAVKKENRTLSTFSLPPGGRKVGCLFVCLYE